MPDQINPYWEGLDNFIEGHWWRPSQLDGEQGFYFKGPHPLTVAERVQADAVLEYWVQRYVKARPDQFGLTHLEGPFKSGPDFSARIDGAEDMVGIEVEIRCENYVKHGHPDDQRWSNVKILIVLEKREPRGETRTKLPDVILHVNKIDFAQWYRQAAKEYALEKKKTDALNRNLMRLHVIAGRIKRKWLEICPDKERDMAVCPYCDLCPYFGDGARGAREIFEDLAMTFLSERETPETLHLGDISMDEIDGFSMSEFQG